jgi:hypothetical protein
MGILLSVIARPDADFGPDIETIEVKVESGPHVLGRHPEMALQVISDAAVFTPRIAVDIPFEALAHPGSQLDAGSVV